MMTTYKEKKGVMGLFIDFEILILYIKKVEK